MHKVVGNAIMDDKIWDVLFDNIQKILYPEIWLVVDSSISKMELATLLLLWRNGETIMTQLADSVNMPMSTATGVVSRLTKKGYVERLTDASNRRIVTVKLTQKGIDTAENMKQTVLKYWNVFTNILTDDEKKTILNVIVKVIESFGKTDFGNAPPLDEQPIRKIEIE